MRSSFDGQVAWKPSALALLFAIAGCATPGPPTPSGERLQQAGRSKVLNVAITTDIGAMGVMSQGTTTGGWGTVGELHSMGLITTDVSSMAYVGRLAERVPSVEDGSMSILPDGQMRVVYTLRRGVTWHDGAPFTAHDLAFTYRILSDPYIATSFTDIVRLMASVEATDDHTAVVTFRNPYYLGNALVTRRFWPQPRHILEPAHERYLASSNADDMINLPYWTSEYVNLGPFRLAAYRPGESLELRAYDGYFLGRPKIDVVNVRTHADDNATLAGLLAGAIDLFPDGALSQELAEQLRERWERSGGGTVWSRPGGIRTLYPQRRPHVQREPAILDVRVRGALYQAIDRDSLANERGAKEQGAWSLLPSADRLYEATKDGFRRFPHDPERAKAILRDVGWTPGPDGIFRSNADGHKFQTQVSNTAGGNDWETPVYSDFWRRIGLEVEEITIPAALQQNREFRALYPGWEASSGVQGDDVLNRLKGPAASAENRWAGNRGGYENPAADALLTRYYASITDRDQLASMRAINDFFLDTLPFLPMYFSTDHVGRRKGVIAYDDVTGALSGGNKTGTYARNAHLWDIQ